MLWAAGWTTLVSALHATLLFIFVDVAATHSYSGRADYDINYLNNIYKRYGKKIWFTEFALPSTMNQQDEMEYMQVLYLVYGICMCDVI